MEKLDKPFTDEQKLNFLTKFNYERGLRIEETDIALYALEDNEILQGDEVIIDPDYEEKQAKKQKQERIEEIKEELNELDLKSIRSIRANETDRIAQYEIQAQTLRNELNKLIKELEEENEI